MTPGLLCILLWPFLPFVAACILLTPHIRRDIWRYLEKRYLQSWLRRWVQPCLWFFS